MRDIMFNNITERLITLMPRLVSINDSKTIQNIEDQWRRFPIAVAQFSDGLEPNIFW